MNKRTNYMRFKLLALAGATALLTVFAASDAKATCPNNTTFSGFATNSDPVWAQLCPTSSPNGYAAVYGNDASTASGNYGVYGASANGIGTFGSGGVGVYGAGTTGVEGKNTNGGTGVYGFSTGSSGGYAVYAYNQNSGLAEAVHGELTGGGRAIHGVSTYANGTAVFAEAAQYGVYATAANSNGTAVYASASGANGTGIFASAPVTNGVYAGIFSGNVNITGNLIVNGTKSFVQEDPVDSTKEIVFASLEGPESGTYCRGTSDIANGKVRISLPESFRLATDKDGLTAQITAVGKGHGLYVESRTKGELVVACDDGTACPKKFDWFVNGVRAGHTNHVAIRPRSRM